MTLLALILLGQAQPQPRSFDATSFSDIERLTQILRRSVALLEVRVKPDPSEPIRDLERVGYGVPVDPHHVATLCFVLENAADIRIRGPRGATLNGTITLYDVKRRVAIVESTEALQTIGLIEPAMAGPADRKQWEDVFAVAIDDSTPSNPSVALMTGQLISVPEPNGAEQVSYRVDLRLAFGAPVFDTHARFLGYSRTVAWDRDRNALVSPESIQVARVRAQQRLRAQ